MHNMVRADFMCMQGRTAKQIIAGASHSCAVLDDNSLKCWGANYHGNLGLGDGYNRGDGTFEMGENLPSIDFGKVVPDACLNMLPCKLVHVCVTCGCNCLVDAEVHVLSSSDNHTTGVPVQMTSCVCILHLARLNTH
jgi:hypothetical protein